MPRRKLSLLQLQRRVSQFPCLSELIFRGCIPLTSTNHLCRLCIHLLSQSKQKKRVGLSEGMVSWALKYFSSDQKTEKPKKQNKTKQQRHN